jgi:hypothetical protein
MKRFALTLLAVISMGSAQAEFVDGNQLLSQLRDTGSYFKQGHAMGYIAGVADMGYGVVHCAPTNLTQGQLNDMIKNYLENTPAERHLTGDVIVNKVLKTMWPCAKRGSAM